MSYLTRGTFLAGRYLIGREIGRGGHSVVYAARDATLGAEVAVKLLVPPPAAVELAGERLRREVLAVRHLTHPHIVPIHEYGTDGPWQFVVMRLVDGQDLDLLVRERGPLEADQAASLGRCLADALAQAHREGILHRDVKPRNILIEQTGKALLTDFGSARILTQATMTETGGLVGTLAYAAPELMAGQRADARSDVYALGLTLYFALSGRLPGQGSPQLPPPPRPDGFHPRAENPLLPAWLDQVVAQATAAEPGDRYATAGSLAEALASTATAAAPLGGWDDRCLVCGDRDPVGLTVCSRCGRPEQAGDHHVFLEPGSGGDRGARAERLLGWFGRAAAGTSHRAVAEGLQPLARVPGPLADAALDRLAVRGFAARSVPVGQEWRAVPTGLWAVAVAALGAGLAAGWMVHPYLLWTSPAVAGLMAMAAISTARRPLLERGPRGPRLGAELEQEIVATAAELPAGTARDLFAGVVRLARCLVPDGPGQEQHRRLVGEVIPVAGRGARELARLDQELGLLESYTTRQLRRGQGGQGGQVMEAAEGNAERSERGDLERRRDLLVQRFLEVEAGLARLVAASSGGDGSVAQELQALAGALERDAASWQAAEREVERLTGMG